LIANAFGFNGCTLNNGIEYWKVKYILTDNGRAESSLFEPASELPLFIAETEYESAFQDQRPAILTKEMINFK
jgi:hypothetical protein